MDGYGYSSGQRSYGVGDQRFEIVSGKSFCNSNQIYATRGHSPNQPPIPTHATRPRKSASTATAPWGGFGDPEMKRKKRIAKYKVYTVEGKVKTSLRNGLHWIKNKCSQIIRGY
ncbi:uncharacterized protein LOC8265155 [Ricinus communis]|uniref:DUF3511 domain-containing protein n=1 Tax=Ricinus communis TaxID=3988 RepID=B9RNH8_RICCO|nr:uncharacterized protein LOC8265155 [Ricinus communis]EEF47301.1 conserved hypothetical protein [Ricinus communis]|eukprot:XP_015572346.1 uncharacterized protein LOC8265155 [Ricinus communis]